MIKAVYPNTICSLKCGMLISDASGVYKYYATLNKPS